MERHETKHTDRARGPEDIEAAMEAAIRAEQRRERLMIGAWVGATVVALVATVMLLESCGGSGSTGTRSASLADGADPLPVVVPAAVQGGSSGPEPGQGLVTVGEVGAHELLPAPPDVVASVSDTSVSAGQAVEVTVEATPDVVEVSLADGLGDAIPMVRDSNGLTWRAHYRVPLRPRGDRLGLSVTAKNQDGRWRRVWLFLELEAARARVETAADVSADSSGTR